MFQQIKGDSTLASSRAADGHTISCHNCSRCFIVFSPGEEYKSTLPSPCPRGDYPKAFFECPSCQHKNSFYWHKTHRENGLLFQNKQTR
jgi:hypothetical protein